MNKIYNRIDWENEPSKKTPVNEDNLNRIDSAVDVIDTRVCDLAGYEERTKESAADAAVSAGEAEKSAEAAAQSAASATGSETLSENHAVLSESFARGGTKSREGEETDNAKYYKEQSFASESRANASADEAASSKTAAASSAAAAEISRKAAQESKETAAVSATCATESALSAETSKTGANTMATNAAASALLAEQGAKISESYAVGGTGSRPGEDTDNARYYKEQAERVTEGLHGALLPMGTITFGQLPDTSMTGYLYNISDQFTTTARFKEGTGNVIAAGTNVYYTADGYWDCLSGSPVTGIKGSAEGTYRKGNVEITPGNIGLGNVANVTTNDQRPTFIPASERVNIESGDPLSVLFGRIMKWLGDLKSAAFAAVANNETTTEEGYVADARMIEVHKRRMENLSNSITASNHNLNTHKSSADHDGRYYTEGEVNNLLNGKINASASCNKNWNWSGGTGIQPTWLWGGNDQNNMYLWNPANFSVNYANTSNSSNNAGYATSAGHANSAGAVAWENVSGKPGTFPPSSHYHDYFPTGGGTIHGNLEVTGGISSDYFFSKTPNKTMVIQDGGFINFQTGQSVQVRNQNDTGWAAISASSFVNQSSQRYKKNIMDMSAERAKEILKLRPVTCDYINEKNGTDIECMIAEEVSAINQYPVVYDSDGKPDGLDYSKFVPKLIKMAQLQQSQIDDLKNEIELLKKSLSASGE